MPFARRFPGRHIMNLKEDIDRFYDEFFGGVEEERPSAGRFNPPVSIEETEKEYILTAELPGLDKDDVQITYQNDQMIISGEKKEPEASKSGAFHRQERRFGAFNRSFTISKKIKADKIDAGFKNGLLTMIMPKAEEARAKEIKINIG